MDLDTQRKEEWCISLQFFLSSRLRTPPYAVASRQDPFIRIPAMIPRTQFLLDGILWAVSDHPSWVESAWLTIQNHIKDTATRFAELSEELARATAAALTASSSSSSVATNAISSMIAPRGSALDRRYTYQAHAAVQDIYVAFCALDVLAKGICAEAAGKLRDAIGAELPQLVAYYIPVFSPMTSYWVADAVEEYRNLFLALLDSWLTLSIFNSDVHRRLQEYMQHRLQRTRDAESEEHLSLQSNIEGSATAKAHGKSGNAHGDDAWEIRVQNIIDSTARVSVAVMGTNPTSHLARTEASGKGAQQGSGTRVNNPALYSFERGVRTPETVERTLRSFLNSIFPPRNTAAARHRCPHCGAPLRSDNAKSAHYRSHFHYRNFLKPEEKLVRLMYPSAADFAEHTGDLKREGHFTRTVEVLEEAYKGGGRGVVKIRRLEDPQTAANDSTSLP